MTETPKRLKKNISFSEHELDIFEYLNRQKNASAFIKKLIRNQMIIDEGIVSVQVVTVEPKKEQVVNVSQEETEPEETEDEISITTDEDNTPVTQIELSEEDLENQKFLPDL